MIIPIYQQIINSLISNIECGKYLPNEKLPSERNLSELYGVNRLTLKKALKILEDTGYLYSIKGKGFFVQENKNKLLLGRASHSNNYGISAKAIKIGQKPHSDVIFSSIIKNYSSIAARLRISTEDPIFALHRIRYGDNDPLAIEYTYIPADLFEGVENQNFGKVSLYDFMDSKGHIPLDFEQKLIVVKCSKAEAKALGLIEGKDALYCFEYIGRDIDGRIVEYTRSYIKASNVTFKFAQYQKSFSDR